MGMFDFVSFEEEITVKLRNMRSEDVTKALFGLEKMLERQDLRIGQFEQKIITREEEINGRIEGKYDGPKARSLPKQ